MTSSLVGSEMCIRDSSMVLDWPRMYCRLVPDIMRHLPSDYAWKCGGHPVSYTHLTLPTICSV
eukprot:1668776-Prorocentrum_lima.AAC.1